MKISENIFLRSIKESQRQDFLDQWNADRCKRERIYISYDSTNKNCQAGDIDIVEFGAAKVDAKAISCKSEITSWVRKSV